MRPTNAGFWLLLIGIAMLGLSSIFNSHAVVDLKARVAKIEARS